MRILSYVFVKEDLFRHTSQVGSLHPWHSCLSDLHPKIAFFAAPTNEKYNDKSKETNSGGGGAVLGEHDAEDVDARSELRFRRGEVSA